MSKVKNIIPSLINGISQQPYALRLSSQAEFQENAYPHVVDGLTKAPATENIKKLSSSAFGSPFVHTIKRDGNEQYKVFLFDGDLKVFDLDGNEKTVNFPDGKTYLDVVDPRTQMGTLSVADYTFILNKTVKTQKDAKLSPNRPPEALLFVQTSAYSTAYRVDVNGVEVASYTTSSSNATTLQTDYIADQLEQDLKNNLGSDWLINQRGSVIHIQRVDGSDFKISVEDSQSNTYLKLIKNKTKYLSNLPIYAPEGFMVEIMGDEESQYDNYYVTFVPYDNTEVSVDETGLYDEGADQVAKGSISGALAENPGASFNVSTPYLLQDGSGNPVKSSSTSVEVTQSGSVLTGKVGTTEIFTVELDSSGLFTFTLKNTLDHNTSGATNSSQVLNFPVTATDVFGNTINTQASVTVFDDGPKAQNETYGLTESYNTGANTYTYTGSGNILNNDNPGADDPFTFSVEGTAINSQETITGAYGTLTINTDGSFSYTSNTFNNSINFTDEFNYTIEDADGSQYTAKLTLETYGTFSSGSSKDDTSYTSDIKFSEGKWEETVKPGIEWKLDKTTMPHSLIREADGTFTFRTIDWGNRNVGDAISNPDPTFVGRTVNDMFFLRNRLSFLSDENVIQSRTSEFFDFYRSTVLVKVANDPIDKAAPNTEVAILKHAVPFSERIYLFSEEAQFIFETGEVLSQETARIDNFTDFECDLQAKPINTGKTVQFMVNLGQYSGVQEFFVQADTEITDTAEVTGHAPRYIPRDVYKLASSSNEDVVLYLTKEDESRIYMYKFFWNNNEKQQSSLSHLQLPANARVLDVDFISSDCYLIVEYPDGVFLEKMKFDVGRADPGAGFEYCIHRKTREDQCTVSYDSNTEQTTITLPFVPDGELILTTRHAGDGETTDRPPGVSIKADSHTGNTVVLNGDYTGTLFYAGEPYTMTYEFSRPTLRRSSGRGGETSVSSGRLNVTRWYITYADSGLFRAVVKSPRRPDRIKTFTGRILGSPNATIGQVAISSGRFGFGVRRPSDSVTIQIINDSFLPCKLIAAEWEGVYSEYGRSN